MENIYSPQNNPVTTIAPENVTIPNQQQNNNQQTGIPKYLYFVIPAVLIIAGLLAYIFLSGGLSVFDNEKSTSLISEEEIRREIGYLTPTLVATVTPSTTPMPIVKGIETYSISQGKTQGPLMSKVTINPNDPEVGAKQDFSILVTHNLPITAVKVTLKTDNDTKNYNLSLASGTTTDGQWSGSWNITDTYLHKYVFIIEATDGVNTSKVSIPVR